MEERSEATVSVPLGRMEACQLATFPLSLKERRRVHHGDRDLFLIADKPDTASLLPIFPSSRGKIIACIRGGLNISANV